ncbi:TrmH family RNA methyltransferase [Christiangramia sp.]|uniref:TrmH family RNA methyltransferase n=1 Tax=Christiangramia sp. TaxID=1931228 RepID=UPI00262AFE61|nr:TrmH family RNA methyltransferase [Christiangramia sp.]
MDQLTHNEITFQKQKFPVVLLLDNITGEANLGSMFRLADAFGIEKIIFCGSKPNLNSNRLKRTARNSYRTVTFEFEEDPIRSIKYFKDKGFKSFAIEITSFSKPMHKIDLNTHDKLLLVAGNERHGISQEVLNLCEKHFHIEMFGKNSSMNVAQSVGIALYEITNRFNKFHKK